jgi:hypothetical protein
MKKDAVQEYANILNSMPSVYSSPPRVNGVRNVFVNSYKPNIYYADDTLSADGLGFDYRYGRPASKGGKYVTLVDLKLLAYIGTEIHKQSLYGWKPRLCPYFIGDYGFRPICRHATGLKMISATMPVKGRSGTLGDLPNDYIKGSALWRPIIPSHKWTFENKELNANSLSQGDILLPFITQLKESLNREDIINKTFIVDVQVYRNVLLCFPLIIDQMYYGNSSRRNVTHAILTDTAPSSSIRVRISKYSDVDTNILHKDSAITIGEIGRRKNPDGQRDSVVRYNNSLVPLTTGKWYFYFDFTNCTISNLDMFSYERCRYYFRGHLFHQDVLWPKA